MGPYATGAERWLTQEVPVAGVSCFAFFGLLWQAACEVVYAGAPRRAGSMRDEIDFGKIHDFQAKLRNVIDSIVGDNKNVKVVQSRIKELESIKQKLARKRRSAKSYNINDLTDIVGFRIIVASDDMIESIINDLSLQLSIIDIVAEFAGLAKRQSPHPYKWAHCVVGVGKNRSSLPEWREYAKYRAEIQVRSAYGDAVERAEHAINYGAVDKEAQQSRISIIHAYVKLSERLEQFILMLDKSDVHEKRDVHAFIKETPFLLHPNPAQVLSEVSIGLGTEFRLDFLVRQADGTYVLVEIENPKHKLFTSRGDFSAPVNHAQRQVEDWQQWIEENMLLVQQHYPDMLAPMGMVVIGRSRDLSKEEKVRLARRNSNLRGRLSIMTYDDLIESSRQFIASIQKNLGG